MVHGGSTGKKKFYWTIQFDSPSKVSGITEHDAFSYTHCVCVLKTILQRYLNLHLKRTLNEVF